MNHADKWLDRDKIYMHLAWMLPRRLVYWCAMRVGAYATQGKYGNQEVPALTMMDAVERWDKNEGAGSSSGKRA
jgi:hypothetical protein